VDVNGSLVADGGADRTGWWMRWPGLATFVFGPEGDVLAYAKPESDPATLTDTYARGVVPVVLLAREHEALHASGLSHGGYVTALCARSGTGKSALALAAAASGDCQWADDTIVIQVSPAGVAALSLPFPVRADAEVLASLGAATTTGPAIPPGTVQPLGRVYLLLRDPSIDPLAPAFSDVRATDRFERLLAHTHPFDLSTPDRPRRMIERWMRIAATVRVCELRFAPSLQALPTLAARLREHIRAG
jgi:hypothetical protein